MRLLCEAEGYPEIIFLLRSLFPGTPLLNIEKACKM